MVLKTTACVAHGTTNIEVSMFWFETFHIQLQYSHQCVIFQFAVDNYYDNIYRNLSQINY